MDARKEKREEEISKIANLETTDVRTLEHLPLLSKLAVILISFAFLPLCALSYPHQPTEGYWKLR